MEEVLGILGFTGIVSWAIVSIVRLVVNRNAARSVSPGTEQIDERLARIEHAVDAMAIEVERISEGQRFTTKLLADRVREPAQS